MIQSPAGYQGDVRIKRYLDFYQAGYGVAMLSSGTTAFTPLSLFAASEPGGWYDPSDLTTLYQDAAGTTPVTAVEQPVGLVLDKSRGLVLGSELVTNGSFDADLSGWALGTDPAQVIATWTASGVSLARGSGGNAGFQQILGLTVGAWYRINFTLVSGAVTFGIAFSGASATGAGAKTYVFQASTTTLRFWPSSLNSTAVIDNISVRELPGAHLSQSTAAARPVLSARVNLLTYTEQFDNAAWTKANLVTAGMANVATAPDGTNTADAITATTANAPHVVNQPNLTVQNATYTVSVYAKANGYNFIALQFTNDASFTKYYEGVFNLSNGTVEGTSRAVTYTGSRATPVDVGNGWYRLSITINSVDANATSRVQVIVLSTNDPTTTYAGNNTSGIFLWGADLRPANAGVGLPAYQRVGAATDYDTTGFPLCLKFDGTDDFLQSSTITPGSVDKAQVFAGVRKLSDVAYQAIAELSANTTTNNGSFILLSTSGAGVAVANAVSFGLRGATNAGYDATTFAAPSTNVLATSYDIAGAAVDSEIFVRVNGSIPTLTSTGAANAGTGNFGSYPLYVGSRGGTTLRFNGHLYSLIVRFSATNLDAATITATETWVNGKTRAF